MSRTAKIKAIKEATDKPVVPTDHKYVVLAKGEKKGRSYYCRYEVREYDPIHRTLSIHDKLRYLPLPYLVITQMQYGTPCLDAISGKQKISWRMPYYLVGFCNKRLKDIDDTVYVPPLPHIDETGLSICMAVTGKGNKYDQITVDDGVKAFFATDFAYPYTGWLEEVLNKTFGNLDNWEKLTIKQVLTRIKKSKSRNLKAILDDILRRF